MSSKTLKSVCKFDVKRTVSELQHEFCDLWNLLADMAENDERPPVKCITKTVLEYTRKLYDALHQDSEMDETQRLAKRMMFWGILYDGGASEYFSNGILYRH